jgi:hypothetical protein
MKTLSLLLSFGFLTLTARATTVSFSDHTFKLSNYSETSVFKTRTSDKVFWTQCPTCGQPDKGLRVRMKLPTAVDTAAVGFINNTFTYNPQTQGAIGSINASVDKNIITNIPVNPNTNFTNTFRPMIEQDGMFYLAAIAGPTFNGGTTGYNTISQDGLVAVDFTQFNFSTGTFGTAHPDFDGDQMLFGLGQYALFGVNKVVFKAGYDNLTFTINPVPDAAGTLPLLFGAGALLFICRATRQRLPLGN